MNTESYKTLDRLELSLEGSYLHPDKAMNKERVKDEEDYFRFAVPTEDGKDDYDTDIGYQGKDLVVDFVLREGDTLEGAKRAFEAATKDAKFRGKREVQFAASSNELV